MTVYLELVMGLIFLVEGSLLLFAGQLTGIRLGPVRVAAAAAAGGLYGGACLLPEFAFLGSGVWRLVSLALMGVIAFGWGRSAVRGWAVFGILNLALGGLTICLRSGGLPLVLTAGGLWLLHRAGLGKPGDCLPLELRYGEKTIHLTALRDTGNGLRDPVTGEGVVVISAGAAETMTGLTREQIRDPLGTLASAVLPGLRLIPYRGIGGSGMMLALRVPEAKLGGRKKSPLVAFAPEGLDREQRFQALTGGGI